MNSLRVGSLCTGFGGLESSLSDVFGDTELVFVADPGSKLDDDRWDFGPPTLLAHRYPDAPNLGDISTVDWDQLAADEAFQVDVLAGGFPCTDLSLAGKQAGLLPGNRSGVWKHFATAIGALRPSLVVIENVGGILSARAHSDLEFCPWCVGDDPDRIVLRALGCVLGDLSNLGFDTQWMSLRASDIGAAHGRKRIFVVAWPADAKGDTRRLVNRDGRAVPDAHGSGQRPDLGHVLAGQPDVEWGSQNGLSLLPTPDASRRGAVTTPSAVARRDNPDRTLNLEDAIALLPTSTASDVTGAGHAAQGGRNLRTEVTLLPTPTASPVGSRTDTLFSGDGRAKPNNLGWACALLPTPAASCADGSQTSRGGDRSGELLLAGVASQVGTALSVGRWGQYTPAIERWEAIIGRPAPDPTVPSRGKNPQLNPVFVEWLMGCPAGWVTDVPGLTRNQQLRLLGNGVVAAQGAHAIRHLLTVTELRSAA